MWEGPHSASIDVYQPYYLTELGRDLTALVFQLIDDRHWSVLKDQNNLSHKLKNNWEKLKNAEKQQVLILQSS